MVIVPLVFATGLVYATVRWFKQWLPTKYNSITIPPLAVAIGVLVIWLFSASPHWGSQISIMNIAADQLNAAEKILGGFLLGGTAVFGDSFFKSIDNQQTSRVDPVVGQPGETPPA